MNKSQYINQKIKETGISTFTMKKEVEELSNTLQNDEQILYITIGVLHKKSSLVTCTDKRLITISSDLIGTTQREIDLERISYIEH